MQLTQQANHILTVTRAEVQARFADFDDPAHGWEHVQRVYHLSLHLAEKENADSFIAGMAALLHDLGRTTCDPQRSHAERSVVLAAELLASFDLLPETCNAIFHAILAHSYSRGIDPATLEACVLYDADRLDSLGASGIMRWAMTRKQRRWPEGGIYHPDDPFALWRTPDEQRYLLDRFFTKLLKLHTAMKTATGRIMAERRTVFLRFYLQELQHELAEGGLAYNLPEEVSSRSLRAESAR